MQRTWWYTFLVIVGAGSTAMEMAGLRLLAPVFGTSLPVWGSAIAVVIGGLAVGYAIGGRRARREVLLPDIAFQAGMAAVLFVWMPVVFAGAKLMISEQAAANSGVGALLFSVLALLVPSVVFGTFSPLASQIEAKTYAREPGEAAGRVFMLTTIGSLLGILLPSFLTIPFFGTQQTVWLFALPILLFALFLLDDKRRWAVLLVAALGFLTGAGLRAHGPTVVWADETAYQYVTVHQAGRERLLVFDAGVGVQSVYTPDLYTNAYWDYPAALVALLPPKERYSVLVLGAAASSSERQMERLWGEAAEFDFTSVELDGALVPVAEAYFDPPERDIVIGDARVALKNLEGSFDLIIVDAYAKEASIPFHLATREFFELLSQRLAPGGIVGFNLNSRGDDTLFLRSFGRTLQESFSEVALANVPQSCNYMLFASNDQLALSEEPAVPAALRPLLPPLLEAKRFGEVEGILMTDNRSPVELLGLAAIFRPGAADCE